MQTNKTTLNILTFNWHEPFICNLAKTGHNFDIVEKEKVKGYKGWIDSFRPVPENGTLISDEQSLENLINNKYDIVICHNYRDLQQVKDIPVRKIFVFHNVVKTELALGGDHTLKADYLRYLSSMMNEFVSLVFISDRKKIESGFDGDVITPGIDINEYGGYEGNKLKVLRIGNCLKERDVMLGYFLQEKILRDIRSTIIGINPTIPSSRTSKNWDELKQIYKEHRVYLNTTIEGYEDGYNLSMLEAMATGMPVVSISNQTSPIIDGENGYISDDPDILHERIKHLLSSKEEAIRLGKKGRDLVFEEFNMNDFVKKWNILFEKVMDKESEIMNYMSDLHKKKIILSYTANPQTTAYYMERSLRKYNSVITYGPTINDKILHDWNLFAIKDLIKPQQIPYSNGNLLDVMKILPDNWVPDLFLWIETGVAFPLINLRELPCITACYFIDTHLNFENHIKIAKDFDYVFIAQKEYLQKFQDAGIENVSWLPLGCDPDIHKKSYLEKIYDVGFVGSITDSRRKRLLDLISSNFSLHVDRCFLEKMAMVFSQSKIIFNSAIKNDLNMRVFESMATGSFLLTDEAEGSGLTQFFKNKEHLVIYHDDEELLGLIKYYLENNSEREKIAGQGRMEVLQYHTYDNRVIEMLSRIDWNENDKSNQLIDSRREEEKTYYRQPRKDILRQIPQGVKKVLEIGCGEGLLGTELFENGITEVVGIELNSEAANIATKVLTNVINGDIEKIDIPYPEEYFDCIICGDVLEHLVNPDKVLTKLNSYLNRDGIIIASIPNVRYYLLINNLINGFWTYENFGICDKTHLRFFTAREIGKLFIKAGYEITNWSGNIDPNYNNYKDSDPFTFGRVSIKGLSQREKEEFFIIQYIVSAKKIYVEKDDNPASIYFRKVNEFIKANKLKDAIDLLNGMENGYKLSQGEEFEKLLLLGKCYTISGDFQNGEDNYIKSLSLNNVQDSPYIGLGTIYLQKQDYLKAKEYFSKGLELNKQNSRTLSGIGLSLQGLGKKEEGLNYFQSSLDMDIEHLPTLYSLIRIAYELKRLDMAKEYLKRYLILHPANIDMLYSLGAVCFELGKFDEVKKACEKIIIFEPDHLDARNLMKRVEVSIPDIS